MKKLLLTIIAVLTILFAQAQTHCDSLIVSGSQYQLTITSIGIIDFWETTAPDGSILGQDSSLNSHFINNGLPYDTITTCLYLMNSVCCVIYIWNGSNWITSGSSTPSWDCNTNSFGCFDPGTGNGQYSTLAACQSACSVIPSWDCGPSGCYDPATGLGQYTNISSCQTVCSTSSGVFCDSIVVSGSQTQLIMQVNNFNSIIDYWISTSPDGTVLGEDSMWNLHNVYNSFSIPNDTITTCITYQDFMGLITCCVTFVFDANSGIWAKQGSFTSLAEIGAFDKKLIKVVDILGKESKEIKNQPLFYIYDDGKVEKRIIFE